jgi:hypothetical protein
MSEIVSCDLIAFSLGGLYNEKEKGWAENQKLFHNILQGIESLTFIPGRAWKDAPRAAPCHC